MHIRPAVESDVDAMHRVRLSVRENQLSNPALVQPHHYLSMLREKGRGWVAEVDGQLTGFAIADLSRSNIWALFVDPSFERRGIGRRLHDVMLDWLFAAGAAHVWLSTSPGTRAERFYRAAAWTFAGTEPDGEVRLEMTRERWLARQRESHQA
jgi:GNAT superfamily N-acetyltransferase